MAAVVTPRNHREQAKLFGIFSAFLANQMSLVQLSKRITELVRDANSSAAMLLLRDNPSIVLFLKESGGFQFCTRAYVNAVDLKRTVYEYSPRVFMPLVLPVKPMTQDQDYAVWVIENS